VSRPRLDGYHKNMTSERVEKIGGNINRKREEIKLHATSGSSEV